MESEIAKGEYGEILTALGLALIEIRATEDLVKARSLADVFHNVPAKMRSGITPGEIEREVFAKAERQQLSSLVSSMFEHSRK